MASPENIEGKTAGNPANEIADGFQTAARIEHHVDAVLRAYDRFREVPCPRCHETCGWCSDYRFMHGKHSLPGTRRKCTIAEYHPDECCPICAGKRRVWMTVTYSASHSPTHAVRVGEVDCYKEAYCAGAARAAQVMG